MLVAVLAVSAWPRFVDRAEFDEHAYVGTAFTAARFAQKLAIATGCDVEVKVNSAGYALRYRSACRGGAFDQSVSHPARPGAFAETPPAGVVIPASTEFYFDPIGRPRNAAGALLVVATDVVIGGSTMRVEAETGFVHSP